MGTDYFQFIFIKFTHLSSHLVYKPDTYAHIVQYFSVTLRRKVFVIFTRDFICVRRNVEQLCLICQFLICIYCAQTLYFL